jgi:hypothetical protein
MSPSSATARSDPRRAAVGPQRRRDRDLRVLGPRTRRIRRRRLAGPLALVLVVVSLLAVVTGQAILAQGQVRLSTVQANLAAEQTRHRQEALALAQLETPSRIVQTAEQQGQLVEPTQINQLPWVPLNVAIASPKLGVQQVTSTTAAPTTTTAPSKTTSSTTPTTAAQPGSQAKKSGT